MRILFIVPYMPNSIRTRPYNLIRALSAAGHEITLITLASTPTEKEDAKQLESYVARVIVLQLPLIRSLINVARTTLTHEPLQASYCWHPELARKLQMLLYEGNYDVVHVEHLRGARYALLAKELVRAQVSETPIVWDSVDCISHLFRQASAQSSSFIHRAVTRFELSRTERYERQLISEFDLILTVSPVDRDAFLGLAGSTTHQPKPIKVLPNGVDLNSFRPAHSGGREPATVVLSGKMSYHANIAMAMYLVEDIMPRVWQYRPDVQVWIVGKDPARQVLTLAADPRITITGAVPDFQPYLARATLAVAPIVYNAGIQNKIMEAMACGTAVITMPPALGGLMAIPGSHLLVENGPEAFASAIISLIESPARREEIARAGRAYVEKHHNWQEIGLQLAGYYEALLSRRNSLLVHQN